MRRRDRSSGARPGGGRGVVVAAVIASLVLAGVGFAVTRSRSRPRPRPAVGPTGAGLAEAPPTGPIAPVAPRPEQVALTAAVATAGGVRALDPVALLEFVDGRARAQADDALLLSLQCFPVRAGARADLTLAGGRCSYEYRSPAGARRPADVPVGLPASVPCLIGFDVDQDVDEPDARITRTDVDRCRIHHAVRPPRCTAAEVWTRAVAGGVPVDAVARVRYAGRYRSGYDPVDPTDAFDRPERGRWSVTVERDGADDVRVELIDDCGQGPPTADERAVLTALERARPALRRCFDRAVGTERSVEALEVIWRLARDRRGATTVAFADPGVDIEGVFDGDLDAIRARWATCADGVARGLRLPATSPEVRLELRLAASGALTITPPPFD